MKTTLNGSYQNQNFTVDLSQAFDLSIPLHAGENQVNCYYAEPVRFETIRFDNFVGSVAEGGPCNYQKLNLTPHGNGTHTECYGHISPDPLATIDRCLEPSLWVAQLITLQPRRHQEDQIIFWEDMEAQLQDFQPEALIIRTLPNETDKKTRAYSGSNPPYLEAEVTKQIAQRTVKHLLIDLPSLDREEDGGALKAHRAFWQYPQNTRKDCSVTELIYVEQHIPDGKYLLNLQVMPLQMDAAPSRPVIFPLIFE